VERNVMGGIYILKEKQNMGTHQVSKWVFKFKLKSIGCINHYKTPLVTKGYFQMASIDYQECFSLVVKITSIRALMATITKNNCNYIRWM
jgi:hypothetical protein